MSDFTGGVILNPQFISFENATVSGAVAAANDFITDTLLADTENKYQVGPFVVIVDKAGTGYVLSFLYTAYVITAPVPAAEV